MKGLVLILVLNPEDEPEGFLRCLRQNDAIKGNWREMHVIIVYFASQLEKTEPIWEGFGLDRTGTLSVKPFTLCQLEFSP